MRGSGSEEVWRYLHTAVQAWYVGSEMKHRYSYRTQWSHTIHHTVRHPPPATCTVQRVGRNICYAVNAASNFGLRREAHS